jgi:hypothetical protein
MTVSAFVAIFGLSLVAAIAIGTAYFTQQPPYAAAVTTFTAAVIALFKEDIVKGWRKPILSMRIQLKAPDCMLIPTIVTFSTPDNHRQWQGDCYFFRLWVENKGNVVAERVQVYVQSVSYEMGDGTVQAVQEFTPTNLRWAHSSEPNKPIIFETLNPLMGKHCDFGSISPSDNFAEVPREGMKEGESTFNLQTEVFLNNHGHRLRPGNYRIVLRVAASNAPPKTFSISLAWKGRYEPIPTDLYSRSITITIAG